MSSSNPSQTTSKQQKRIQRIVAAGVQNWQSEKTTPAPGEQLKHTNLPEQHELEKRSLKDVLISIPRRQITPLQIKDVSLPLLQQQNKGG